MTKRAINFAKVLFDLKLPEETVKNTGKLLLSDRQLSEALASPAVKLNEKHKVIDAVFDKEIRSFLKVLCDHGGILMISDILEAYESLLLDGKNMMKATLFYAAKPGEDQLKKVEEMLCRKYRKSDVILDLKQDFSLVGGFILTVGDTVYDKSIKGALLGLSEALARR